MLEQTMLEQLFRQNYSKMIHLASILLGNGQEAEDVVQDVFLRVARSDLPPRSDHYLLTAVRNACLNRIRHMRLHERVKRLLPVESPWTGAADGVDEPDTQPLGRTSAPPSICEEDSRLDAIATFVDEQLDEPHRSIVHLRFDDDLTIAEIARRLALNPNTTYKYLAQSIQQIKQHFNNH